VAGNSSTLPHRAQPFRRRGLDPDLTRLDAEELRETGTNGRDMGSKLGALGDKSKVRITNLPAEGARLSDRPGENPRRIHAGKGGVGVGEELTDIRQPGGPQHGVGQCMKDDIRVGVTHRPYLGGDLNPAQHAAPAGGETVDVVTKSDAKGWLHGFSLI